MLKLTIGAAVLAGAASVSFAASLPAHSVTGNYIEARTADVYTGPCFANGEAEINGKEAVFGWKINQGKWQGVDVAGLSVVGVVHSLHTLGNVYEPVNPAIAVLIVDSRANAEQRLALQNFARKMGGDLLEKIVKVEYAPIELTVEGGNIHGGAAHLTAGSLAAIRTRAMQAADHTCGNEDIYYPPLTALEHAMPAFALEDSYQGGGLGETWKNGPRRSAFLGTFRVASAD
ncbi:MAG TPA: DUF1326 domain-containing protein [Candidatus Sulfopaludibacter sp.]|nr:DUF1326 domain-containing protein [Candidatus Sulfopaludibacter sp.]